MAFHFFSGFIFIIVSVLNFLIAFCPLPGVILIGMGEASESTC